MYKIVCLTYTKKKNNNKLLIKLLVKSAQNYGACEELSPIIYSLKVNTKF